MTGVGSSSSQLFVLGPKSSGGVDVVETFSWSGTVGTNPFISSIQALGTIYDCAWYADQIWVANDGGDSPVKAYDTSGALVNNIPGSLVDNAAHGVDFDSDGYLWVANNVSDKIYKLDLSQGTGEGPSVVSGLTASSNPFMSSTVIAGEGFGPGASIEIFDLIGRRVLSAGFDGSYCWDGESVPAGTYMARVSDGGLAVTLRLIKL